MSCRDFEPLLNPYLDGELPIPDVLATEAHLAGCLVCRKQYEGLEQLRAGIAAAKLDYRPPATLARRIVNARKGPENHRSALWWGSRGLVTAAAVVLLVMAPRVWAPRDPAVQEVLDSHLRSLLSSNLVDAPSSDRHTVKPWFQGKVGFSPDVPDLSHEGFVLVGGRLDVVRQQRAVALVYKRREHVINLLMVEAARPSSATASAELQGYHLISWTEGGLAYWAVSDLNSRELGDFVQLVRRK